MHALDRARKQLAGRHVFEIAQRLYRCDKGKDSADLRTLSEECQAVYIADALMALSAESRMERVKRIHALDAQVFAGKDDEQESVARQARQDIARFGGRR